MTIQNLGIKSIVLNFDQQQLTQLELVQGDTRTRGFDILIASESGLTLPADSKYECRLFGVNSNYPDKTFYSVGTIVGDRYRVYLTTDMISKAGRIKLQVGLYEGTTALIQSDIIELDVKPSMLSGGEVGSDLVVDFTKLTLALARVDAQEKTYSDSLEKQTILSADVTKKHGEVTTMHTSLKSVFDSENERVQAESARVTAESGRATAETGRVNAETTRIDAEEKRSTAESNRSSAESTRVTSESSRVSSETERVNAENERVQAENTRVTSESSRVSSETGRVNAEDARIDAEGKRASAETTRTQKFASWQSVIDNKVLPPATPTAAGVTKIDVAGQDTAASTKTVQDFINEVRWGQMPKSPRKIASGTDINTIIEPGFYYNDVDADVETMTNVPVKTAFALLVIKTAGIVQVWFEYERTYAGQESNKVFTRGYYKGNEEYWGEWQRFLTNKDADLKADKQTVQGFIDEVRQGQIPKNAKKIAAGTDINTIIEPGFYYNDVDAEKVTNAPTDGAFSLLVMKGTAQLWISYSGILTKTYVRGYTGNTWNMWMAIPTPTDLNMKQNVVRVVTSAPTSATGYSNGDVIMVVQ